MNIDLESGELPPQTTRVPTLITFAMVMSLVLMTVIAGFLATQSKVQVQPEQLNLAWALCFVTGGLSVLIPIGFAFGGVLLSPSRLKPVFQSSDAAYELIGLVNTAAILPAAMIEAPGMLGAATLFIAGSQGAINAEPKIALCALAPLASCMALVLRMPTRDSILRALRAARQLHELEKA